MSKRNVVAVSAFTMIMSLSSIAMASDGSAMGTGLWIFFGIAVACGFAIGVAALGTGIGMGNAINGALQGVARNPEAGGRIFTMLVLGLALIESLCIYALVICLLMIFKIPALDTILKAFGA
jgi:F-type H+-transporting ATPase subunit c